MSRNNSGTQVGLSELSVTEFLSLARMGFVPRGVVVGVCFYDAGMQMSTGWTGTREVTQLTNAMRTARSLAVGRLRDQAHALGAEGVVEVKLDVEHHVWRGGHTVARFVAVGTAIDFEPARVPQYARAPSLKVHGKPFTSDLKAAEFVTLMQSGYRPVGLAMGNCVIQISRWALMTPGNYEIEDYTRAFMDARETAMLHLEKDLFAEFPKGSESAPTGVVGMSVTEKAHPGAANVVEYTAVGTAVTPLWPGDPRRAASLPAPQVVVPLDR